MRKEDDASQKPTIVSRSARALSSCIRVISSGASTVARSAVSSASSAVNRDTESFHDQVLWAGFDTLEKEDGDTRRLLLLAFHSGFQVWDVQDTDDVHVIASEHDGQASFMQMLPNPIISTDSVDIFSDSRPLLAVCGNSSWEENLDRRSTSDSLQTLVPTDVYIYSLMSQSYVHTLKFRSVIYTVRCSSRIVAVLQEAQIHCFDATTLETDYVILTNSIAVGSLGVGYGPLAVGPRWIAYSGSRIANSTSTHFTPEHFSPSSSPTVAQFARESSRQIASGIVSLGDKGYKSLSRYCSDVLPNPYIPGLKGIGVANENVPDADSIGMVIVKDIISKSVVTQFKAHKSPISALCFDPSGRLLLTASTQGHNINVFLITPIISTSRDANIKSSVHLFRLQRGFTNAVIQDISFCNDSYLIAISSARGTSHLFEINPEVVGNSPIPLFAINRIRCGNVDGWMSGAAAVAAEMVGGSLVGAIASTFCYSNEQNNENIYYSSASNSSSKKNLLVFDPSGWMTQYAIKANPVGAGHKAAVMTGFDHERDLETEGNVEVEPIRRWSMIQNQSRREVQDRHSDMYGGGKAVDSKSKVFPEIARKQSVVEPWRVSKKGKAHLENKNLYMSEAELRTHRPAKLPSWARANFRYQELVLNVDESSRNRGTGEMEIEGVQTRTIETREKDLVPAWGYYLHSPQSQQVMTESSQSPGNITEGDQVAPLESRGTESEFGVEENQSKTVDKGKGIAEEKNDSEDEGHGTETEQSKEEDKGEGKNQREEEDEEGSY